MSTARSAIVDAVLRHLRDYIFPDRAAAASAAVRREQAEGGYDDLDEAALCRRLTNVLSEHCADKHLRVRVRKPDHGPAMSREELDRAYLAELRTGNYGIAAVQRLDGNVGLIDLRAVADPSAGGPAIAAAMLLVARTDALIVDLRNNGGGAPHGVAFWNSYFFPDEQTHLNDIFDGATGTIREFWTLAWVPGERYLGRPVYLLTSTRTFSGGEEFAYNLKTLGRATLIGETTGGGAHPTRVYPISATVEVTIPIARAVNPVTGTNWEGTGVEPDICAPADEAFAVAYRAALTHVIGSRPVASVADEARAALAALARKPPLPPPAPCAAPGRPLR